MTDDLTKPTDAAARAFWENVIGKGNPPFDELEAGHKLRLREIMLPVVQAVILDVLEAAGYVGPDGLPKHLPMAVDEDGGGPAIPGHADHFACWCMDPKCQWTVAFKAAAFISAAQECFRTAAMLEKMAGLHDGPLAPYLATQDRTTALTLRARGDKLVKPYRMEENKEEDGEQQNEEDGSNQES